MCARFCFPRPAPQSPLALRLHRWHELGHQLLPLALPRLQFLDSPENLALEPFYVEV